MHKHSSGIEYVNPLMRDSVTKYDMERYFMPEFNGDYEDTDCDLAEDDEVDEI